MTRTDPHHSGSSRLHQARLERQWSQRELATRLGTTPGNVGRWERGVTQPGIYFGQRLCQIFALSAQDLGLLSFSSPALPPTAPTTSPSRRIAARTSTPFPICSLPLHRNPFFTGREPLFQELHRLLTRKQGSADGSSLILSGLAGIGKTQTALEYAYRYHKSYSALFWISAETMESIVADLRAIAELLSLPERLETNPQRILLAFSRWLARGRNWLLIVDNVEDVALLKRWLPSNSEGALLCTSRRTDLDCTIHQLPLAPLSSQEGLQLFLRRTRYGTEHHLVPVELEAVRGIVERLAGLPLALDQAAAYLEATRCSPSDYLLLLQAVPLDMLEERESFADHPLSVRQTFRLIFAEIARTHPIARDLLTVCAYLAPEAIPDMVFLEGAPLLGPDLQVLKADVRAFQRALKIVLTSSLLQRSPGAQSMTIHRLVQTVLKAEQEKQVQQLWQARVLSAISTLFPQHEWACADYHQRGERLLPHALVCLSWEQTGDEDQIRRLWLMRRVIGYLTVHAHYKEAQQWLELLDLLTAQLARPEPALVAAACHGWADLHRMQGRYQDAYPLYQRALGLFEQASGPEHPQVGFVLNGLGSLFLDLEQFEQAEVSYQHARALFERQTGAEYALVRTYPLNVLALLASQQGQYVAAEPLHQQVLLLREHHLGPEHHLVARVLYNLAATWTQLGRYEEAEPLYVRALALFEQQLGPEHFQTVSVLTGLAQQYKETGRYREAEQLYRRALALFEQQLGPEHLQVSKTRYNLAEVSVGLGKAEQAEQLYQDLCTLFERQLGPEHMHVSYPLNGLAELWQQQGKDQEAEPLYQRALRIREQSLGGEHPDTARTLANLARLWEAQGQTERAREGYARVLGIRERTHGPHHPTTRETRLRLSTLLSHI